MLLTSGKKIRAKVSEPFFHGDAKWIQPHLFILRTTQKITFVMEYSLLNGFSSFFTHIASTSDFS